MKIALLCISLFVFFSGIHAKLDFLSDYRQTAGWREDEDYSSDIERFARYLQNKEAEAEAIAEAKQEEEDREDSDEQQNESTLNSEPPFVYSLPKNSNGESNGFAFPPSDLRFFLDDKNVPNLSKSVNKAPNEVKRKETTSEPAIPETVNHLSVDSGEAKPFYSARLQPSAKLMDEDDNSDIYFIAAVAGCSAAAVVGVVAVGISCYRLHKNAKAAADVEYPAYGVTGPNKDISPTSGDRRLAQSAQMYHYQHQKQQIIAMESRATNERHGSISDAESDEENEEGDYTVYECPGLASTGEMEVKNPLFQDDPTPASPAKQPMDSSTEKTKELPK